MAGTTKNWYISVMDNVARKTIIHKTFFVVAEANKWIKENEEKYPKPQFTIYKENY